MSYSSDVWMLQINKPSVMNGTMNNYRSSLKKFSALVNCTGIVGNNLLNNNQIRIYPNPSNGKILIQNLSNITIEKIIVRNNIGDIILLSNNINYPFH